MDPMDAHLAECPPKQKPHYKAWNEVQPSIKEQTDQALHAREERLSNGVTVYGDEEQIQALSDIVRRYERIWTDQGMAQIPRDE